MKTNFYLVALLTAVAAGGAESLAARSVHAQQPPSVMLAVGQWISGTVEDVEVDGENRYITLDGVRYRTMPQVTVQKQVGLSNGAYNEVPGTLADVRRNRRVALKVQGFRIYRIMVSQ